MDGSRHQCTSAERNPRARPVVATRVMPLQEGDVLRGGWEVEAPLGMGAMGRVYRARHTESGALAAVKILNPDSCRDPDLVARFEREALLLASLRHPNIVDLFDVGRRGALPYLVMALVEGVPLSTFVTDRGGTLRGGELLDVAKQVCAGLAFIHGHKLVHRDIKPTNILVDDHGHCTILDLGVARDLREPLFTAPGMTIGTPHYMAPEQIGGPTVDHRADIYGLGALLFEVITGQLPFDSGDEHEIMRQHLLAPPPSATDVDPSVPRVVSEILQRAMAKNREERFPSALSLYTELERALAGEQTNHGYVMRAAPPSIDSADPDVPVGSISRFDTDVRGRDTLRDPPPPRPSADGVRTEDRPTVVPPKSRRR